MPDNGLMSLKKASKPMESTKTKYSALKMQTGKLCSKLSKESQIRSNRIPIKAAELSCSAFMQATVLLGRTVERIPSLTQNNEEIKKEEINATLKAGLKLCANRIKALTPPTS